MGEIPLLKERLGKQILKEPPSFDLCAHAHVYLLPKADGSLFLSRPDIYMLLCRRFSMKKKVVKALLKEMRRRNLIINGKRGVELRQQSF